MKQILIIGCAGSGKTTLAKKLANNLQIPLIELDYYFWLPNWKEGNIDQFTQIIDQLSKQPAWIMDGTYLSTLQKRCIIADTIIFLDFSRWYCFWGICKRYLTSFFIKKNYKNHYPPTINPSFLNHVWSYPILFKPRILQILKSLHTKKTKIITLKKRSEIASFLINTKK